MGFIEEVEAQRRANVLDCRIRLILGSADDADDIQQALDNPEFSHTAIARVMSARGLATVTLNTLKEDVSEHRRGTCNCG